MDVKTTQRLWRRVSGSFLKKGHPEWHACHRDPVFRPTHSKPLADCLMHLARGARGLLTGRLAFRCLGGPNPLLGQSVCVIGSTSRPDGRIDLKRSH